MADRPRPVRREARPRARLGDLRRRGAARGRGGGRPGRPGDGGDRPPDVGAPPSPGEVIPPDDAAGRRLMTARVLQSVAGRHGTPESLVDDARQTVDQIKAFIRDRKILTLPEPDQCRVIAMPEFMRGKLGRLLETPRRRWTPGRPASTPSARPRSTGRPGGSRATSRNTTTRCSRSSPSTRPTPGTTSSSPTATGPPR